MAAWPGTLPNKVLVNTYQENVADYTIRSENSVGPDKVRRRTTSTPTQWTGTMRMSKSQVDALLTFIHTTLEGGVLTIQWAHQRTDVVVDHRFREMPEISHVGCDKNDSGNDIFNVSLAMEILP